MRVLLLSLGLIAVLLVELGRRRRDIVEAPNYRLQALRDLLKREAA